MRQLRERLSASGVNDFVVQPHEVLPDRRIVVQLPEVPNRERIKRILLTSGELEMREIISPLSPAPVARYPTETEARANTTVGEILPYDEREADATTHRKEYIVVQDEVIVNGRDLRDAQAITVDGKSYQIHFTLNPSGAARLSGWTAGHINYYLAVILNKEIRSVAYIQSAISDSGQINGKFTKEEAEDLALLLRSGSPVAPITFIAEGKYDPPVR